MRIAVDAMGGDNAPREIVRGAIDYATSVSTDEVILVGDSPRLEREIAAYDNGRPGNVRVVDAPEVVEMGEHPATAIRSKRRSSIVVATDLVRDGEADAVVSAGSTGAVMAAAVFRLGRIEGIDRPALPAHMLTATGPVMLLDVGANVDSDPENLVQFAAMGAIFAEHVLHVHNPRIGLLNIGEEAEKGDSLTREAHEKLAALDLRFVGNVEAHDMIAHRADVVVCDGFVGNVVIKFFEGITSFIFRALREDLQQGPIAPLALLALKPGFDR
ncbi:MAG: phosphate acyltransferase PlsX, partial [Chloroflexota bacterium]|nr:phosphate acyltransferase PlsX [Chloroflexota bacterium]